MSERIAARLAIFQGTKWSSGTESHQGRFFCSIVCSMFAHQSKMEWDRGIKSHQKLYFAAL